MKRQPIASAAVFFVMRLLLAERGDSHGESAEKTPSSTDGICRDDPLY